MSQPKKGTPKTRLLYYEDAYLKEFDAEVSEIKEVVDRYSVILDQTAFYPAGGGQPADTGVIRGKRGEATILDVQMANGTVVHVAHGIEGKLGAGEQVKGSVDWDRRYALMKNHTAAHLMAETLRRVTGTPLKIIGSAIGVEKARLDFAYEKSLGPLLPKIEEEANSIVGQNQFVEVKVMKRKEAEDHLKRFHEDLEILPRQVQNIRIVEVKDLHACACGGTHVRKTSEIGTVKILRRRSKGKGVERIEFVAKSREAEQMHVLR